NLFRVLLEYGPGEWPARDDALASRVCPEGAYGRDHDRGIGTEPGGAALDVEEPLSSHVRPEARFCDQEVACADPDEVGYDRGVPGGDVSERAGVHEHRGVL